MVYRAPPLQILSEQNSCVNQMLLTGSLQVSNILHCQLEPLVWTSIPSPPFSDVYSVRSSLSEILSSLIINKRLKC
ncbi:rCG62922 [Rattus norvegicus]|uniref:RCG62922 n=1 Tax=Rattus norvegicus TaxID=10116 RepID=A6I1Q1_RAT|nr:rCG62922 [Rattus norvegicus]